MTPFAVFALLALAISFWWIRTCIPKDGLVVQAALTFALWAITMGLWLMILTPYGIVPVQRIVSAY